MESKKEKAKNFLQRMYHLRVKVDRKGTPIVNVSSIFGIAVISLLFSSVLTCPSEIPSSLTHALMIWSFPSAESS